MDIFLSTTELCRHRTNNWRSESRKCRSTYHNIRVTMRKWSGKSTMQKRPTRIFWTKTRNWMRNCGQWNTKKLTIVQQLSVEMSQTYEQIRMMENPRPMKMNDQIKLTRWWWQRNNRLLGAKLPLRTRWQEMIPVKTLVSSRTRRIGEVDIS